MSLRSSVQIRCFLCRRRSSSQQTFRNISETKCSVSQKPLKDVLNYLALNAKTELHIPKAASLCQRCYGQLLDYDSTLVKLLRTQKSLIHLVEGAALGIDDDLENEIKDHMSTMDEFNDDHFFDDIEVSDNEVIETMREAMHDINRASEKSKISTTIDETQSKPKIKKIKKMKIECQFCVLKFKSKAKLQAHTTQAHRRFSCQLCDFSHRNEDYVTLHMNLHDGRPENQCRFCHKTFTTKISTIRHMEVHMNSKKYQCDKCGLCFSQTTVLYNHKLQHEAEEDPLRCEICDQVFKTKRTYRHHMITHQANRPRYSCEYCSKTFTEKYTLKVHKRTHSESIQIPELEQTNTVVEEPANNVQSDSKYSCIICEQSFLSKDNLNKHMEKEHDVILKSLTLTNFSQYEVVNNGPKRPCQICGHMFSTQTNLDFHLENVHGMEFK